MARRTGKKDSSGEVALEKVLGMFAANYRARNLSENTVDWYVVRLQRFIKWYTQSFGKAPMLSDFNPQAFQLFILTKQGEGVYQSHPFHKKQDRKPSSSYIHGYYRVASGFGNWLVKNQLAETNPMGKLELPKMDEKQLQPLTPAEEKLLLDSFSETTANGCRTKAIMMLMLDTGLRRAEVVSLKFEDVNLEDGFLLIKGKGSKERWIPFGFKTGAVMLRYATLYRSEPATDAIGTFFLDPDGYAMTTNALKMLFYRVAKRTGITRLHPHLLRHTYGIRSQELNMPSLTLQRYMGHADVRTTERYAHAAQSEKIKRERGFSHLDQLPVKVKRAKGS